MALNRVGHQVRQVEAVDFFNLLTGPELLEITEALLPQHRERLYPPTETLSVFMTGAYCKARLRLPVERVRELARHAGETLRWRNHVAQKIQDAASDPYRAEY